MAGARLFHHARLVLRIVRADFTAAVGSRRRLLRAAGAGRCGPWRQQHGAGNRRRDHVAAAARAGLVLLAVEPVLHDPAALVAHGFIGLRQEDVLFALIEGLHQPLAVDQVERGAVGVFLGLVGEAARGDEKSPLGIGGNNRIMQVGKVAGAGRYQVGGCGACGDEFPPGLGRHQKTRVRVGLDRMAEALQHFGNDAAESRGRHGSQRFEPGNKRVCEPGDFLSA